VTEPSPATAEPSAEPSTPRSVGAAAGVAAAQPGPDVVPLLADVALVTLFAAIGRRSHGEGDALRGVLATAWPFVTGSLLGWSAVVVLRRARPLPGRSVPAGAMVWLGTVAGGLVLRRVVAGGGTPPSFVVVAATVLALFLVGWRLAVRLRRRRSDR